MIQFPVSGDRPFMVMFTGNTALDVPIHAPKYRVEREDEEGKSFIISSDYQHNRLTRSEALDLYRRLNAALFWS